MGKKELIIDQIKEAGDELYFTGKLDDDKISLIEIELKVKLPASYKWFLKEYGFGGLSGVENGEYFFTREVIYELL